jgi:hypothetical protein
VILLSAIVVAGAVIGAAGLISRAIARRGRDAARNRSLELLALFAPAVAAAEADPRALLVWAPLARTARRLLPEPFGALDAAAGGTFPFPADRLEAAHARWTAEWLAWEAAHDAEYKRRAVELEADMERTGGSPAARARLADAEREKLSRYQQRYEEYVRVAKALQGLQAPEPRETSAS